MPPNGLPPVSCGFELGPVTRDVSSLGCVSIVGEEGRRELEGGNCSGAGDLDRGRNTSARRPLVAPRVVTR